MGNRDDLKIDRVVPKIEFGNRSRYARNCRDVPPERLYDNIMGQMNNGANE
ncbi:MAG: hypothetical protein VKJ24_05720 [Synechococcales bacterium]|nr:hypothetical protein [Synechococcales bacterium]